LKLDVYFHLWMINLSFDRVVQSLDRLRRQPGFRRREVDRFRNLSEEARAATNSYIASVVEVAETDQAGRRYRKRLAQERKDEQGQ